MFANTCSQPSTLPRRYSSRARRYRASARAVCLGGLGTWRFHWFWGTAVDPKPDVKFMRLLLGVDRGLFGGFSGEFILDFSDFMGFHSDFMGYHSDFMGGYPLVIKRGN